uniref:Eukaryotic initiation factor 4G middle domain containing protein n=1 Tax=Babesia bovis TaxID=5865 RepID=S6C9E5_BABBO|nr:eukaryotic initiation factor 4G middle domain containing protein [Babesia bovis]
MGELFLRKVISVGILKRIVCTLLQMDSDGSHIPCEYLVESFLELITTIGYTLEQMPHGPDMLNDYMGHLTNLKKNGNYSLRIVYKIQDLIDLRAKNWVKKVFKERATSVADIHLEAKQEELKGGSIHLNQEGKFTTAGRQARRHYSDYLMNQRQLALSKMVNGVYVAQDKSPDEPAPEPSTAPETSVSCDPVSPVLESSSSSEFPKSALKSDPNKKHPGGVRFADKEPRSPADDVMDVFKHDPPHDRFTVEWNQLQMSHSDCLEALSKMIDKCLNAVSVSKAEIRGDLIAYTIGRLLPSSRCKIEAFSIFETTCLVRLQDEVLDNPGAVSLFARILYKVLDYFYKQPDISLERINLPPEFDLARDLAVRVLDSMKDSEDSLHYARGLLVSSFACFEDHDLSFLDA